MMIKYKVTLTELERRELHELSHKGSHKSQKVINALILLGVDNNQPKESRLTNESLSNALRISMKKIDRVKKRFVENGMDIALNGHPSSRVYEKLVDGELEARIIALSCSKSPKGRARWSLRLLAEKAVELEYVDSISHETVRGTLKQNELKPWKKVGWVIPPEQNADFVANMENVLQVYKRPYNEENPVVCVDEGHKQLIGETKTPIESKPGSVEKFDYEYVRNGSCNIFMSNEPLAGKRFVQITERKQQTDWALFIKEVLDQYPNAQKVTLVMDNYETHKPGSLYKAFPPDEARKMLDRIEIVYTPKHGSWLNMAEIELNVLTGQCLDRRIPDIEEVKSEVKAWAEDRNNKNSVINWQFTTDDARIKLKRLYPVLDG